MLTCALVSPVARSEVYHEPHLAHDEAILIYGVDFPSLARLVFWRIDSRGSFTASTLIAPKVVKAGWYFLRSYVTIYADLTPAMFPLPKRPEEGIELVSGAVNYIGDVIGTFNGDRHPPADVKIEIKRETLVKAREQTPWLEKYPLFVSMQGREPTSMSWLDVRPQTR
jgi:hypothetical protein